MGNIYYHCELCQKQLKGLQPLSKHLRDYHNIVSKEQKQQYYDKYFKKENEEICPKCGKLNHLQSFNRGYTTYCYRSCQVSAQNNGGNPKVRAKMRKTMKERYGYEEAFSRPDVKAKSHSKEAIEKRNNTIKSRTYPKRDYNKVIRKSTYNNPKKNRETVERRNAEFEKEHNCTQIKKLIEQYGQGWLSLNLPHIDKDKNSHFISNEYLTQIQEYASINHSYRSKGELQLYEAICEVYRGKVTHNDRTVIKHYELDVYIPSKKLAFEFNGTRWHSIQNGMDKYYHINKSLACKEKGIRLIHIYEFEDFEEQLKLAKDLVKGKDNYSPNDFNKNNFINKIPYAVVIYNKGYTVYGAEN